MLLNAKDGFYKGSQCDQYLFKLLLGPLQIFWPHDASVCGRDYLQRTYPFFAQWKYGKPM